MKAKLISSDTTAGERAIRIERFPIVIGRDPEAEIQSPDPAVSALHCEIDEIGGRLMVRDLGSENGTFVNGLRVEFALLLPGDKLTVAKCSFIASYDPPSPATAPPGHTPTRNAKSTRRDEEDHVSPPVMTFFDLIRLLERQRRSFRKRYGGDLSREEAMFPDPPHPEHIEHLLVEEMKRMGTDPAVIFAFEKTGLLLTEFNYDTLSNEELAAWKEALVEYEEGHEARDNECRFPAGAVAMYGPDEVTTTMVVAAVMTDEEADPIYRRWVGSRVRIEPSTHEEIADFFLSYGVRSVLFVEENVGCPHEEGVDYPVGEDCPFCPYWTGRQGD